MQYDLDDLLDTFRRDGAAAIYLTEGFAPIFAIPGHPPDETLPSVSLFAVEGPVLKREDLVDVVDYLTRSSSGGESGYRGLQELRFRKGNCDFDIFVFSAAERTFIEVRRPNV
jgi:hypothetical protein